MKLSEHEHNCQVSYPDYSGYHYVNLCFNWQFFATCLVHEMNCQTRYLMSGKYGKYAYLCDFWHLSGCILYIDLFFGRGGGTDSEGCHLVEAIDY